MNETMAEEQKQQPTAQDGALHPGVSPTSERTRQAHLFIEAAAEAAEEIIEQARLTAKEAAETAKVVAEVAEVIIEQKKITKFQLFRMVFEAVFDAAEELLSKSSPTGE